MVEAVEIPRGYKQTEVGVIPNDWEVTRIGDVFNFKNGLNKEKSFFGKGTPIVNYMDVYKNSGIGAKDLIGKVTLSNQEIKNYDVKKGDVFFTRTSETVEEIGIASVVLEGLTNTVFSGFVLRARPFDLTIEIEFCRFCFSSKEVRKQIISTASYTTRALTNGRLLSDAKIPLPPTKAEQTAIATALNDTAALITQLEKLIAKKRNIKLGAMQELLKPKEGWEVKKLGDFLDYEQPTKYLVVDTKYNDHNQTPVLTAGKSFILGYTNEEFGIFTNFPVIIFDDFTTSSKFVDFPFKVKSSAMKMLKLKNKNVNLRFMFKLMQIIKFDSTDHKRYWISEYQNIEVKVPKSEERTRISQILSDMDAEIESLEKKMQKYQQIKQGMMQNLLTGKIRLV